MKTPADVDLIQESMITFVWDSLDKVAAFVAFVYFANYFSTNAFGAAYTVIAVSMIFGSVPNAVAIAIQKRVSEDTTDLERFFLFGTVLIVVYTAITGGLALVTGSLASLEFAHLTLAGIAHLFGRPFLFQVERLFDGVGSPSAAAGLDFVDGLLTAGLRFVLILGLNMGAEALLYSGALSGFAVGGVAYLRRFGVPTTRPEFATFQDVKQFSGWSLISRLGNQVLENSIVVIAGTLFSPTFASYVKSARNLIEPARIPVRSIIKPIFVEVSAATEQGNRAVQPVQNGIDIASIFAIPLVAGAVVLGDQVMVTLYGAGYTNSGYVLVAIAAGFVFVTFTKIMANVLSGANRPELLAKSNALTAAVSVPVFVMATLLGGKTAFLLTVVACYAFNMSLTLYYAHDQVVSLSEFSWRFTRDQSLAASVMALVVAVILTQVQITSWIYLVVVVGLGGGCYAGALLTISNEGRRIASTILEEVSTSD